MMSCNSLDNSVKAPGCVVQSVARLVGPLVVWGLTAL